MNENGLCFASEIVREQRLLLVAYRKRGEHSRIDHVAFETMLDSAPRLIETAVGEGGDPEPAELACVSFTRSLLELRQQLRATSRSDWSRQFLTLACAMAEAVLALDAGDLPLEAELEMGCQDAREKMDRRNATLLATIDQVLADMQPGSHSEEP